MTDRALRVIQECTRIAAMTEEPGRTTRRYLTPPMRDAHRFLRERMELLGMRVHVDAAGNLRGIWTPRDARAERLLIGSHLDTVPNAGAFDGVLGVVMALEWVRIAQEIGFSLPIEVIGFSEEEGVRYGVPFLGSRAVAGSFDSALLALEDAQGVSLERTIRDFGLNPSEIGKAAIDGGVLGFIEVHIEQGPVLDAAGLSVAAVTAIVGQTRGTATFKGHGNHAGTTPMHLRHDGLAAGAEWVSAIEALATRTEGLVATAGKIVVAPNAANVIPGLVSVSLDCRHANDAVRNGATSELVEMATSIANRRRILVQWQEQMNQPVVPMDQRLTGLMIEAITTAGLPAASITSGAGHDAMIMASRVPATMLFLRSPGGISHDPSESVLAEDVEASLRVAEKFLERLAADVV
ncbi:MAG TPA: allantoate amidohydrolase [Terracidiphilus sp.]|nr:allantoate amidohydrolase [Terracidiphilus sp.]